MSGLQVSMDTSNSGVGVCKVGEGGRGEVLCIVICTELQGISSTIIPVSTIMFIPMIAINLLQYAIYRLSFSLVVTTCGSY